MPTGFPMTAQQDKRCYICGAEMSADNSEICKNFHVQRAQQPQREYIITEEQIDYIEKNSVCLPELYDEIRSRPHTPAPSRLNTQPKGCTCEDCIRFRDAECPYPDSNITMNRCNSFLLNIEEHNAAIAHAATLAENKRVLDAIVSELEVSIYWSDTYMEEEPYRHILTKVESLRQSTTAAQEDEQP
jgi:hypothetical protein